MLKEYTMKFTHISSIVWCFFALQTCTADSDSALSATSEATLSEDGKLNFSQLVSKYGQSVEQHEVVTEDGYILTLFHIPGKKPPVLLIHGITDSSDTFIISGNSSWVILLATEGYDLWVANNRGNLHARHHVSLDPDTDKEFWDFSFHEIGYYDTATAIDFVRGSTGYEKIAVMAHSQGTSSYFALASLRPEYNERVKVFIALAPIAFMNDMPLLITLIAEEGPAIAKVLKVAGIEELLQNHKALSNLITALCSKGLLSYAVCGLGLQFLFDLKAADPDFVTGVVVGHSPRATSRKCLEHYDQIVLRRSFAQYDYGAENIDKYGRLSPPEYNLTAVTTKIALFVGKADPLATVKNVELLRKFLPNVVHYEVMKPQSQRWSHLNFVWGKGIPEYLFQPVIGLLNKYN